MYIKPALTGDEPLDVRGYAASSPAFPQESTADQYFSESQFESYRALGEHSIERLYSTEGEAEGEALVRGEQDLPTFVSLARRAVEAAGLDTARSSKS